MSKLCLENVCGEGGGNNPVMHTSHSFPGQSLKGYREVYITAGVKRYP